MTSLKIYKLRFTSPLHIGDRHDDTGVSLRTIESDTLYSALLSCLAKTGQDIPADGDLGVTISGLFPYYQKSSDSKPVYFLPMPMTTHLPNLEDVAMAKKVKKAAWVDAVLYSDILAGNKLFSGKQSDLNLLQGSYMTSQPLPWDAKGNKEFVKSSVMQRVTVGDRTGKEDAKPYNVDRITFKDMAGLYFIADGDTTLLDKAINILSMEGIGTDRNVGFGFFDVAKDSIALDLPASSNHAISLSAFVPEDEEQLNSLLSSEEVAYSFERRGGWITTHPYNSLRKNAIYMFMPGSVFHVNDITDVSCMGKIVNLKPGIGDITPNHPIWRCGRAIMLPIIQN